MPPPARPPGQPNLPRIVNPSFAVVRRGGYDKAAVDSYVAQQQHDAAISAEQLRSAGREVARLQEVVTDLESRLAEMGTPTWSGLGSHAAALLRIAEDQATNVTVQAQQAADESRTRIEREAAALRADAEKEAADIRAVALHEMEQRRQSVLAEAEHTRALAASESGDLLAAAKREADQVKIAARQEATTLLQGAKREAEQARAAADREAAEARRILAVERERMTKESTDRHSTAAAETARLVEEAEARANAADERTRAAIETANRHREQSMAAGEESLARARREAEQLVASARKQAEQILSNATADVDRQLAAARHQLTTLQKRRDGIVTQLSQLRDLVSSFAQADDVLEEDPTRTPAQIQPPTGR
jgi:cell division septum initiation protein DivIVA